MKIETATNRNSEFINELLGVWEVSVRATHHFLMEDGINAIKPQVQQALTEIDDVMYAVDENRSICGFMAVGDGKIEMLFIHPVHRGHGIGKKLVYYAVNILKSFLVDVNEQNTQGVGFYKHMGFRVISRSPLDGNGNPFPVLHMSR